MGRVGLLMAVPRTASRKRLESFDTGESPVRPVVVDICCAGGQTGPAAADNSRTVVRSDSAASCIFHCANGD